MQTKSLQIVYNYANCCDWKAFFDSTAVVFLDWTVTSQHQTVIALCSPNSRKQKWKEMGFDLPFKGIGHGYKLVNLVTEG